MDFNKIEKKWQKIWEQKGVYEPDLNRAKKPFYNLMMFPYPSAEGLHVGNMYAFTGSDIYGRFKRMQGYDVFEPIGLDGFGIHSENYALKIGAHPMEQAKISEKRFYKQLEMIGNGFAWNEKLETYDPEYYKWTQWIFIQLFKNGLAYRKKQAVNWCPSCKTVLADEQVISGKCERCGTVVVKKDLEQWFFKITKYAERLLKNLGKIDWSDRIKIAQREWIGKSEGALIEFRIQNSELRIPIFTTRPDTLFGATYMVLAPEHPLIKNLEFRIKNLGEVENYIKKAKKKTDEERIAEGKEKTGVELKGIKAINPANKKEIPIFVADYVLASYGTGAIMAVPAHDERDFEFAKKYELEIKQVIQPYFEIILKYPTALIENNIVSKLEELPKYFEKDNNTIIVGGNNLHHIELIDEIKGVLHINTVYFIDSNSPEAFRRLDAHRKIIPWIIPGVIINSGKFNGMNSEKAKWEITKFVGGKKQTQYHLRDWLISRQRYWGAPIPMIYCEYCAKNKKGEKKEMPGWYAVPEKDLPVKLPFIKDFRPKGKGESPLATVKSFYEVKCPVCGKKARRETDVSDTFLDSAWYYLRYPSTRSARSGQVPWDSDITRRWLPVNMYIGGAEHAVLHLLYSRFITMFFYDSGLARFDEPFNKFRAHGLLIREGAKMSKSKGNVVNPDEYIKKFGADTLRMYLMFLAPFEQGGDFRDAGLMGIVRFLERIYKLISKSEFLISKQIPNSKIQNPKLERLLHQTIKKITEDIEELRFNTAISALMILFNKTEKNIGQLSIVNCQLFLKLLAPFAPHITEELWHQLGHKTSIHLEQWPKYDPKLIKEEEIELIIQVNGKFRDRIKTSADIDEEEAKKLALQSAKIKAFVQNKEIKKVIFVKGRLVNIVV